jgi:hypothetical protein
MRVCFLMILLQVAPLATAELGYTEDEVVNYAKALPAVRLDQTLPSQRLDKVSSDMGDGSWL